MAVDTLPPRSSTACPDPEETGDRASGHGTGLGFGSFRPSRFVIAGLVLAFTLISLFLRSRQLSFYYWIDEAISVGISSHPLSQLPHLLREDGSPPLYYVLLHFWIKLFGSGEVATHSLSLVFGLLAVPVSYWAGSSLFGRRAGAFTAVLAAGLPFLTSYAQETRMYALLALLSLVVATSFVHVYVYRRRRYLPLFAVALAAALYTHNWALFEGVGTFAGFLFCAWSTPPPRRDVWRDGLIGFGVVALLYLPWLPTRLSGAAHRRAMGAAPGRLVSVAGLLFHRRRAGGHDDAGPGGRVRVVRRRHRAPRRRPSPAVDSLHQPGRTAARSRRRGPGDPRVWHPRRRLGVRQDHSGVVRSLPGGRGGPAARARRARTPGRGAWGSSRWCSSAASGRPIPVRPPGTPRATSPRWRG